ncbi:conserved exported hypothetical protein [Burkholderia sp. 8Y]|uniref:hypothetical protein n=1 Tax=Burkholderia sp. 8Y TaxID=2653133 RepID=UPI0012F10353|nr:hypothetical protein [Burkholderia sp. 8Y]VXC90176.1 conserved exported hypothetical protein [Burkholderia sp. 8Y]
MFAKRVFPGIVVLSLAACGGGGGSESTNQPTGPGASVQQDSTIKLGDSANSYAAAKTATSYALYGSQDTYRFFLNALFAVIDAANRTTAGTYSEACSGGGTVTATLADNDNSQTISRGDTATLTFSNCRQWVTVGEFNDNATVNGGMTFRVKSASGAVGTSSNYSIAADVTSQNYAVGLSTGSVAFNGTMSISDTYVSATGSHALSASSNDVVASRTLKGVATSIALSNWSLTDDYSGVTRDDTVSLSGNVNSSTPLGTANLSVSTVVPVLFSSGLPYSGSMKLATTADAVTVTFAAAENVTLSIDPGKKGVAAATVGTTQTQLNSAFMGS